MVGVFGLKMGVSWLIVDVGNAGRVLLERFVSACGARGYGFTQWFLGLECVEKIEKIKENLG